MGELSETADSLVAKVKTREAEAKQAKEDGEYLEAIDSLREAIGQMEDSGWRRRVDEAIKVGPDEKLVAQHLAECFGMMGGNYRAIKGGLPKALQCFGEGRKYESDQRFEIKSSYSLVNELVVPIEMRKATAAELREDLQRAVSVLQRQVQGIRRLDRWAWADLGECRLLIGDVEGAREAYQRFKELADGRQIGSARGVLERLAVALKSREPDSAASLRQGVEMLK